MELADIFRIVNLAIGTITALGGIASIFYFTMSNIIIGAYLIVFGLCIALLEFQIPPQVSRYASFLFSLIGRGVFYLFLGGLILGDSILSKIAGSVVGFSGIAFIALEFVPSIEAPANMREAEMAGWGAEQV